MSCKETEEKEDHEGRRGGRRGDDGKNTDMKMYGR